jgi:hypothetical protein
MPVAIKEAKIKLAVIAMLGYGCNEKTNPTSSEMVEFAIKLPGSQDGGRSK